jgi:UDP-N-acetylmuramate dehydrogenase
MLTISQSQLQTLREVFSARLQERVALKRHTAARIGGEADVLIAVGSAEELEKISKLCWEQSIPFTILGSGSNVLVSDLGVRQLVVLNQAKQIGFNTDPKQASVWCESGTNFGALARQAAAHGFSGLEWAAGIPGTVGGAVYGNAGAHGSDMSDSLLMANILHLTPLNDGRHHEILQEAWPVEKLEYGYRTSSLKRQPGEAVVLSATMRLNHSTPTAVKAKMDEFSAMRHSSQPTGASLGSIFKNPPGDYAGRLIEAVGLKGTKIGKVEISTQHANFFISQKSATANNYAELIRLAQAKVLECFGINLELEIELLGDWKDW